MRVTDPLSLYSCRLSLWPGYTVSLHSADTVNQLKRRNRSCTKITIISNIEIISVISAVTLRVLGIVVWILWTLLYLNVFVDIFRRSCSLSELWPVYCGVQVYILRCWWSTWVIAECEILSNMDMRSYTLKKSGAFSSWRLSTQVAQ